MARITTLPAAMKARIEEIPELAKCVVIYKSATVEKDFESRMNKVAGVSVIIRNNGGKNQASGKKSAFIYGFTVTLFMVPTLKQPKDCETLMSEIEAKLNGWWPDSSSPSNPCFMTSENLTFPDDNTFDIAVLTLKTPPIPLI